MMHDHQVTLTSFRSVFACKRGQKQVSVFTRNLFHSFCRLHANRFGHRFHFGSKPVCAVCTFRSKRSMQTHDVVFTQTRLHRLDRFWLNAFARRLIRFDANMFSAFSWERLRAGGFVSAETRFALFARSGRNRAEQSISIRVESCYIVAISMMCIATIRAHAAL